MRYFLLLIFSWLSFWGMSQIFKPSFDHISIDDGLSNSIVQRIYKDSKGYMWFATDNGLNRYDGFNFTIFTPDPLNSKSISGKRVSAIIEDDDQDLLLGTWDNGLSIYHPKTELFQRFENNSKKDKNIPCNFIRDIIIDKKKSVWIASDCGGLLLFNKKNLTFKQFKYSEKSSGNMFLSLVEDVDGKLWIATFNEGILLFDPIKKSFTKIPDPVGISNYNSIIKTLFLDKDENLWISTEGEGLLKYNIDENKYEYYRANTLNQNTITSNVVRKITQDKEGRLWIACDGGGLSVYNPLNKKFDNYTAERGNSKSLSTNQLYNVFIDNSGIFWIGTYSGGINVYNPLKEKFDCYRQEQNNINSLSYHSVLSVYQDVDSDIWIGTDGGGLDLYNLHKYGDKFIHFKHDPKNANSISTDIIKSIYQDDEGSLWFGTFNGGLNRYNKKLNKFTNFKVNSSNKENCIGSNNIWAIFEDSYKKLWISCLESGVDVLDRKTLTFKHYKADGKPGSISHPKVWTIFEDSKHELWFGTECGGVNLYDRKDDKFIIYQNDPSNPNSLAGNDVRTIFEDSRGNLWFGTVGNGLDMLNKDGKTFTHYTMKNGLPNNAICGILEDSDGNLWISTIKGISKFNFQSKKFRNYDKNDGLQSNEFTFTACMKSVNGYMYFGGIEGLNYFLPNKIIDNPVKPKVIITDFLLDNKIVSYGSSLLKQPLSETKLIKLKYNQNFISFRFAAISFTQNIKNKYAYKMEGLDKSWNLVGSKREANYTNLDPGEYTFMVKACNNDGIWNNDGTSIKIIILPPFWKTLWFRILAFIIVVCSFLIWYKNRVYQVLKQKEKLEIQVKERTIEIHNQKEELNVLNDEIKKERDFVIRQGDKVAVYNEKLLNSLKYGKRVQRALLPSKPNMYSVFPEHFVLNKPKDVVSGDFYWLKFNKKTVAFAVADCTGHGVPGAFWSMLGMATLNEIVKLSEDKKPKEILFELREWIIYALRQTLKISTMNEGMNIGFGLLDLETLKLQYSGAYHPLYLIRNGEFLEFKGDRMPIGTHHKESEEFTNYEIQLYEDDSIYLFSDGFSDQLGGEHGRKYGSKAFQELLLGIQDKSMKLQRYALKGAWREWKGKSQHIDDILVLGIKVKKVEL